MWRYWLPSVRRMRWIVGIPVVVCLSRRCFFSHKLQSCKRCVRARLRDRGVALRSAKAWRERRELCAFAVLKRRGLCWASSSLCQTLFYPHLALGESWSRNVRYRLEESIHFLQTCWQFSGSCPVADRFWLTFWVYTAICGRLSIKTRYFHFQVLTSELWNT